MPQEGFLFAGTLRDNVRVGRPEATDAEVEDALERARPARPLRARSPKGLDTEVRERGSRLSAGERQLVSLARAALADPSVLVLDEATSNLDPGTEHAVERAMETLMHGRTSIVVAHRLSTAARADRIGVVYDGRLAELGSHDELVAQDGHYAELYRTWAVHQAQPQVPTSPKPRTGVFPVLVAADEVEHLLAGPERVGVAGEAVDADREDEFVGGLERELVEARVGEPGADLRGERRAGGGGAST